MHMPPEVSSWNYTVAPLNFMHTKSNLLGLASKSFTFEIKQTNVLDFVALFRAAFLKAALIISQRFL